MQTDDAAISDQTTGRRKRTRVKTTRVAPPAVRRVRKVKIVEAEEPSAEPKRKRGRPKTDPKLLEIRGTYKHNPGRRPKEEPVNGAALEAKDYAAIALRYAEDVVAGRIVACRLVKLACQRHLDDLRCAEKDPSFGYFFDASVANRFCANLERYHHVKGRWAERKERLVLQPWQCFAVAVPFGWIDRSTGRRRFREIYLTVPRKNAKSTLAAAIGLNMLLEDGEHGAEVYSGATSEKQAWEVFGPAKRMVELNAKLRAEHGLEVWAKSIVKPSNYSRFQPLIGKPGDGASPSCAIVDEYHEHDTTDLYDTMVSGMGAREQPMVLIITTAGVSLSSPCYDKFQEAKRVLEGVVDNPQLFALVYTIDEPDPDGTGGDDWTDPAALRKANPNLGVSVDEEFLLAQQKAAVLNQAYQTRFKTKHLNVWCSASVAGINIAAWKACADREMTLDDFRGWRCWAALDLASKTDIADYVKLFVRFVDGVRHYYVFAKHYLPEDTIEESRLNRDAYRKWVGQGWLTPTDGAEIDFDLIREDVRGDAKQFQFVEVVYDPWRATQLAHQLAKDGATVVEFGQTAKNMSEAFDELLTAVKSGRLHHCGDPVLEWMASCVVARQVAKGLVVPGKDKREHKIDGIVALTMAIGRAMHEQPVGSFAGWLKNPVMV